MIRKIFFLPLILLFSFCSCQKEEISFQSGDLKIAVETGEEWLHDFPLFMGLSKKNAPQFVIWMADEDSQYVSTLYCTHKIAREAWVANKGNRRKESLPFWAHQRGVVSGDGLLLPTKEAPLADGITGATPKGDSWIKMTPAGSKRFILFAEFNHSVDFNEHFPVDAISGSFQYSGGAEGSGQPAVVYATLVDLNAGFVEIELDLVGHSSPDGSNGKLYFDLSKLSSAKKIVKRVVVSRIP